MQPLFRFIIISFESIFYSVKKPNKSFCRFTKKIKNIIYLFTAKFEYGADFSSDEKRAMAAVFDEAENEDKENSPPSNKMNARRHLCDICGILIKSR